ncbi:TAXI family TRAP transporter solute-binding subunit [Salicibibacter cibi]|uniref:TAXI family TRAP transporter solute-binding subunit n=1 Tax=Salicibibacter cibi TaxID=2743001 RepID=A0A7T7CFW7_9BACI|nr:TAXI family TRAP transporter solute-binding subunit [Salicibibacter cibi]QQK80509.1 TAXI family TRAP transporter solute-binding subunit [Salicibibacter cibi]
MEWKNILTTIMIVLLFIVVTGCGSEEGSGQVDHATIYAVGGGGGYMLSSGFAEVANEKNESTNYTLSETNGDIEGMRMVMQGNGELLDVTDTNAGFAYNGTHTFEGEQYEEIRGVAAVEPIAMQYIVREDSNIDTLSDLEGASIATFQESAQLSVEVVLNEIGLERENDYTMQALPAQEQMDALRDNNVDAVVFFDQYPSSTIQSLDETTSVKVLEMEEDLIDTRAEEFGVNPMTRDIEADSPEAYSGQTEDVTTAQIGQFYITSEDVDEDLIYEFTKTMFDNTEELETYSPRAEGITVENTLESISVPLHPGAERYLREEGHID